MHTQTLCTVGAIYGLLSLVAAIPAIKNTGTVEICGAITVYVTVAPPSSSSTTVQLSSSSLIDYGGISKSGSDISAEASTIGSSIPGSGFVTISTSTTHLTTTVSQIVSLTRTVFRTGFTSTETIDINYSTTSALSTGYMSETYATSTNNMNSVDAILASISPSGISQAANTVSSGYVYPIITVNTKSTCSGDLVNCRQTSASIVDFSSSIEDITDSQAILSTSTAPIVYVFETLTVIPLATISTDSSNTGQATTFTTLSTVFSTVQAAQMVSASSTPVMTSIVYVTTQSSTTLYSSNSSSGGYTSLGAGGWNTSMSSDSFQTSTSNLASLGSGMSTTSAVDALSSAFSTIMSSSFSSIKFWNSYTFPNATTTLAAEQGFTAFPVSSVSSNALGTSISELQSVTVTWLNTSQTTEAARTESCSIEPSAMSTANAEQSTIILVTAASSYTYSSALSNFTLPPLKSSVWMSYNSSTAFFTFTTTSAIGSVLSSSSDFTTSPTYSIVPSSTNTILPAEDTCTDLMAPSSPSPSSLNPSSAVPTFTTLTSGAFISASSSSTQSSATTYLSISTTTLSTSSSSATPTLCGEHGAFTLNFDDLPILSTTNASAAKPEPLFSPYWQFTFSAGWSLSPPPLSKYIPSSPPLMISFLPVPNSALGYTGALGSGENALLPCFNFNALGMSVGCDSAGPEDGNCEWQFTGLRYNFTTKDTDAVAAQRVETEACPASEGCELAPVMLDGTFVDLTELRVNVTVAGKSGVWWLDDLQLAWFDDGCGAGLCRVEHP